VDSPLGNPPQLGQAVVDVGRVWQFAAAKLPYGSKQVSENKVSHTGYIYSGFFE